MKNLVSNGSYRRTPTFLSEVDEHGKIVWYAMNRLARKRAPYVKREPIYNGGVDPMTGRTRYARADGQGGFDEFEPLYTPGGRSRSKYSPRDTSPQNQNVAPN